MDREITIVPSTGHISGSYSKVFFDKDHAYKFLLSKNNRRTIKEIMISSSIKYLDKRKELSIKISDYLYCSSVISFDEYPEKLKKKMPKTMFCLKGKRAEGTLRMAAIANRLLLEGSDNYTKLTKWKPEMMKDVVKDVFIGLLILNQHLQLYHGDIKLNNILLFWSPELERYRAKIADFGLSGWDTFILHKKVYNIHTYKPYLYPFRYRDGSKIQHMRINEYEFMLWCLFALALLENEIYIDLWYMKRICLPFKFVAEMEEKKKYRGGLLSREIHKLIKSVYKIYQIYFRPLITDKSMEKIIIPSKKEILKIFKERIQGLGPSKISKELYAEIGYPEPQKPSWKIIRWKTRISLLVADIIINNIEIKDPDLYFDAISYIIDNRKRITIY